MILVVWFPSELFIGEIIYNSFIYDLILKPYKFMFNSNVLDILVN